VNQQSLILGSVFEVQVTAKAGVKPEDLEKAINAEIDVFRKDGGGGGAHASTQRARIENHCGPGDACGFGGVADRLNSYNHYLGTPIFWRRILHGTKIPRPNRHSKTTAH